jgi:hypothetical protein
MLRGSEAKAYLDSLIEAQEVWALRKMGYVKVGALVARLTPRSQALAEDDRNRTARDERCARKRNLRLTIRNDDAR